MVETFLHFNASTDLPEARGASPKSKIPPRSTKNGSSTGPQNTFSPVEDVVMALSIKVL